MAQLLSVEAGAGRGLFTLSLGNSTVGRQNINSTHLTNQYKQQSKSRIMLEQTEVGGEKKKL